MKEQYLLPDPSLCREKFSKVFQHLTARDMSELFGQECIRRYKKNSIVYEEGTSIKGCYFIFNGYVKIYKIGTEGKEQIIKFEQEGNLFGFRSVVLREAACTSVQVITDAILCFIPDYTLFSLMRNNNDFAYELMQIACKELGEANCHIRNIAQKSVKTRIADIILALAEEFGTDRAGVMKLSITREDLANFAGTATETVIRLLSEFKSAGLIEIRGRRIRLVNMANLKAVAE